MLKSKQLFSNHLLENEYIDINLLVMTLNAIGVLKYKDTYDVINTRSKDFPLKPSVISFYENNGVCKDPIVVTDDDFCLDGRHRVAYRKEINDTVCSAYIAPKEYIPSFIKRRAVSQNY